MVSLNSFDEIQHEYIEKNEIIEMETNHKKINKPNNSKMRHLDIFF